MTQRMTSDLVEAQFVDVLYVYSSTHSCYSSAQTLAHVGPKLILADGLSSLRSGEWEPDLDSLSTKPWRKQGT